TVGGMRDCLAGGGEIGRIRTTARRLVHSRPFVESVYLYMDPWGFVWPEQDVASEASDSKGPVEGLGGDAVGDGQKVMDDAVVTELRSRLAAKSATRADLAFGVNERYFLFAPMGGRSFYAGYSLAMPALQDWLRKTISSGSGAGIQLVIKGPGTRLMPLRGGPSDTDVVVTDSLGDNISVHDVSVGKSAVPLAVAKLPEPLGAYELLSYSIQNASAAGTGLWRSRLYAWTIILLAGGIIAGVLLVLGQAAREIQHAKSKSEFVIGVSHDLRTPVASVRMLAESLYLGHIADPEKQKLFLKTIVNQSERLQQLVERVLYFVRFGQNSLRYHMSRVDIVNAARQALELFEGSSGPGEGGASGSGDSKSVAVELPVAPVWVNGDAQALQQVVLNLLDNARKYGASGKTTDAEGAQAGISLKIVHVQRGRRDDPGEVCVSVRDHGPGVAQKELKRIFEKYYRSEGATDKNLSGVGLGLALCKHVVEGHGGKIRAENAQEGGLRVLLTMPASEA
ncbi:MAG: HAMP domain-containing sensor histidine kinase, partial [Verrucomicrobia bacterium]|nr:HAMP domain-containing sensor histidine kinase [Verrucomicrobiota bacterium]